MPPLIRQNGPTWAQPCLDLAVIASDGRSSEWEAAAAEREIAIRESRSCLGNRGCYTEFELPERYK